MERIRLQRQTRPIPGGNCSGSGGKRFPVRRPAGRTGERAPPPPPPPARRPPAVPAVPAAAADYYPSDDDSYATRGKPFAIDPMATDPEASGSCVSTCRPVRVRAVNVLGSNNLDWRYTTAADRRRRRARATREPLATVDNEDDVDNLRPTVRPVSSGFARTRGLEHADEALLIANPAPYPLTLSERVHPLLVPACNARDWPCRRRSAARTQYAAYGAAPLAVYEPYLPVHEFAEWTQAPQSNRGENEVVNRCFTSAVRALVENTPLARNPDVIAVNAVVGYSLEDWMSRQYFQWVRACLDGPQGEFVSRNAPCRMRFSRPTPRDGERGGIDDYAFENMQTGEYWRDGDLCESEEEAHDEVVWDAVCQWRLLEVPAAQRKRLMSPARKPNNNARCETYLNMDAGWPEYDLPTSVFRLTEARPLDRRIDVRRAFRDEDGYGYGFICYGQPYGSDLNDRAPGGQAACWVPLEKSFLWPNEVKARLAEIQRRRNRRPPRTVLTTSTTMDEGGRNRDAVTRRHLVLRHQPGDFGGQPEDESAEGPEDSDEEGEEGDGSDTLNVRRQCAMLRAYRRREVCVLFIKLRIGWRVMAIPYAFNLPGRPIPCQVPRSWRCGVVRRFPVPNAFLNQIAQRCTGGKAFVDDWLLRMFDVHPLDEWDPFASVLPRNLEDGYDATLRDDEEEVLRVLGEWDYPAPSDELVDLRLDLSEAVLAVDTTYVETASSALFGNNYYTNVRDQTEPRMREDLPSGDGFRENVYNGARTRVTDCPTFREYLDPTRLESRMRRVHKDLIKRYRRTHDREALLRLHVLPDGLNPNAEARLARRLLWEQSGLRLFGEPMTEDEDSDEEYDADDRLLLRLDEPDDGDGAGGGAGHDGDGDGAGRAGHDGDGAGGAGGDEAGGAGQQQQQQQQQQQDDLLEDDDADDHADDDDDNDIPPLPRTIGERNRYRRERQRELQRQREERERLPRQRARSPLPPAIVARIAAAVASSLLPARAAVEEQQQQQQQQPPPDEPPDPARPPSGRPTPQPPPQPGARRRRPTSNDESEDDDGDDGRRRRRRRTTRRRTTRSRSGSGTGSSRSTEEGSSAVGARSPRSPTRAAIIARGYSTTPEIATENSENSRSQPRSLSQSPPQPPASPVRQSSPQPLASPVRQLSPCWSLSSVSTVPPSPRHSPRRRTPSPTTSPRRRRGCHSEDRRPSSSTAATAADHRQQQQQQHHHQPGPSFFGGRRTGEGSGGASHTRSGHKKQKSDHHHHHRHHHHHDRRRDEPPPSPAPSTSSVSSSSSSEARREQQRWRRLQQRQERRHDDEQGGREDDDDDDDDDSGRV